MKVKALDKYNFHDQWKGGSVVGTIQTTHYSSQTTLDSNTVHTNHYKNPTIHSVLFICIQFCWIWRGPAENAHQNF